MAADADDPGATPDATGRRLEHLPAALLGNGSLLVTLSARGELERLLWPHVDGPNNLASFRLGVRGADGVDWLDEPPATWSQGWEGDVSVLRTTVIRAETGVEIRDVEDICLEALDGPEPQASHQDVAGGEAVVHGAARGRQVASHASDAEPLGAIRRQELRRRIEDLIGIELRGPGHVLESTR